MRARKGGRQSVCFMSVAAIDQSRSISDAAFFVTIYNEALAYEWWTVPSVEASRRGHDLEVNQESRYISPN